MNYKIIFRARALEEIQDSYNFYENNIDSLGEKFLIALENKLNYILNYPEHNKQVRKEFRQAYINKFPFVIIYKISKNTIVVYSVFHTRRNPKNKF